MIWLAALAIGVLLAALLHLQLAVFTRLPRRGFRVLMYHRVTSGPGERYAMPLAVLRRQIEWLRSHQYHLVPLGRILEAIDGGVPLPDRAVLLTFDDGTEDALELLAPLLRELRAPAALFVVPGWAGTTRQVEGREQRYLDAGELRAAASTLEIGLHGYAHEDLRQLGPGAVEGVLCRAGGWLERERVPFLPALAYPYGAYPRKDAAQRAAFLQAVRTAGVRAAFRIGNRVNPLPLGTPLEICRTEIRGDEPFWVFAWKLRMGRRKAL